MMQAEIEVIVFGPGGKIVGTSTHADREIIIGKGEGATIVIDDASLSDEHALIHFTGRSALIEPIGGALISLDGEAIESHLVQPGDTITIGEHTVRCVVHRSAEPPRPRVVHTRAPSPVVERAVARASVPAGRPITSGALALKLEPVAQPEPEIEEEDDEDEDDDFVPFSLLDMMRKTEPITDPDMVEAIRARDGLITKVVHLPRGKKVRFAAPARLECQHETGGGIIVRSRQAFAGHAFKEGQPLDLASLIASENDMHTLRLQPGTSVQLAFDGEEALLLQHTERAAPLKRSGPAVGAPTAEEIIAIVGAIILHIVACVIIGLTSGVPELPDTNEGRYVEVKIKDLELEKPPPPPKPVKAEKVNNTKAPPVKTAQKTPAPPQPSVKATKMLSALSAGLTSPNNTASALAAATNLDAVTAPKGAGFQVSGTIGKMAGNELKLGAAGSGVGRIDTKTANELNAGALGRVKGSGPNGNVKGVVSGPPPRSVQIQGSLDRNEIQKVVNANLYQVQGCYERQLVRDPSLGGKLTTEWVITPEGTVSVVKIKASTVRSNEVATCIQGALKTWKFPKPTGGSVTVTYPFVFSTIGS